MFKDNIHHNDLLKILKKTKYKLIKQILNYDGKKIALLLETPSKNQLYVPSNVSNILDKVEIVDMNELTLRLDLKTTVNELLKLSSIGLPTKPLIKVKEDNDC